MLPHWHLVSIGRSLDRVVEHPVSTEGFPRSKRRSSVDRKSSSPRYHFRWYSLSFSSAVLCLEDVVRSRRRETKSILRWEYVRGKGLHTMTLIVARSSNHLDSPRINDTPKTVSLLPCQGRVTYVGGFLVESFFEKIELLFQRSIEFLTDGSWFFTSL